MTAKTRKNLHPSAEKVHFQGDAGNSREQRRGQKKKKNFMPAVVKSPRTLSE
jgi:hypothetical protein